MTTHRERLLGQARADLTALPYVITDQYGVHAPECPCGQETAMSNTLPEVPMPDDPAAASPPARRSPHTSASGGTTHATTK